MSHDANTALYELASEHVSFWAGEGIGAVLEADIAREDLESLQAHLIESAQYMNDLNGMEVGNFDIMTDERAEAMFEEAGDEY